MKYKQDRMASLLTHSGRVFYLRTHTHPTYKMDLDPSHNGSAGAYLTLLIAIPIYLCKLNQEDALNTLYYCFAV